MQPRSLSGWSLRCFLDSQSRGSHSTSVISMATHVWASCFIWKATFRFKCIDHHGLVKNECHVSVKQFGPGHRQQSDHDDFRPNQRFCLKLGNVTTDNYQYPFCKNSLSFASQLMPHLEHLASQTWGCCACRVPHLKHLASRTWGCYV